MLSATPALPLAGNHLSTHQIGSWVFTKAVKKTLENLLVIPTIQFCVQPAHSLFTIVYAIPYTGCNRRNGPDFGRVFLMLNYTEKPQNTYIQSSMVTEI